MFKNLNLHILQYKRQGLLTLIAMRSVSTERKENADSQKISKNIQFWSSHNNYHPEGERPLVLLYGWLVAKTKHMYKYGDYYLGKGFDVLQVKLNPDQLLWPKNARKVVNEVLDFTTDTTQSRKPILYHGFSAGGYLFGETLVQIHSHPDKFQMVGQRLKGQIFDSPIDYKGIPKGVSRALSNSPVLQNSMQAALEAYLRLFYNSATKHYIESSDAARDNKLKLPTLFLYSKTDVVAAAHLIEERMELFENNGIQVHSKCFDDSNHVEHLYKYPEDYIATLDKFLLSTGLYGTVNYTTETNEKISKS